MGELHEQNLVPESQACPRLSPFTIFFIHRQVLVEQLWRVRSYFRGLLLDLGCYNKPYESYFRQRCSAWMGFDRLYYLGKRTRADVGGDALRLPFREAAFDTVLCTQVLDEIQEPQELFTEIHRILKPAGHLILSAPQYRPPHERYDYFRFSRHALCYLAEKTGLEVIRLAPQGGGVALVGFVLSNHFPFNRDAVLSRLMSASLQFLFLKLDRWCFRAANTMGWVIVCRKRSG